MKLRPIAAIALRQFYLLRSSPTRVLPMIAWVAIDIILWGFISRYLNTVASTGVNFISSLLGAVLFWDFFTRVMQGVTMAFFEDVWSRNFINVFATPLLISEYLTGLVLTGVTTSLVGLIVMLVLATWLFGLPFFSLGVLLLPFLLVLFLFGIALGVLASAMVLRLGPANFVVFVAPDETLGRERLWRAGAGSSRPALSRRRAVFPLYLPGPRTCMALRRSARRSRPGEACRC